jgi:hypothetical protein
MGRLGQLGATILGITLLDLDLVQVGFAKCCNMSYYTYQHFTTSTS